MQFSSVEVHAPFTGEGAGATFQINCLEMRYVGGPWAEKTQSAWRGLMGWEDIFGRRLAKFWRTVLIERGGDFGVAVASLGSVVLGWEKRFMILFRVD